MKMGKSLVIKLALQWRHNGRDSVSNHQPHDCFLNRLFRRRSKKTSKLRVTGLCAGNSPGTGEFPAQMASNAENVYIWWRHHEVAFKWFFHDSVLTGTAVLHCFHTLNNCSTSITNQPTNPWTRDNSLRRRRLGHVTARFTPQDGYPAD